jgi:hypothetical protein
MDQVYLSSTNHINIEIILSWKISSSRFVLGSKTIVPAEKIGRNMKNLNDHSWFTVGSSPGNTNSDKVPAALSPPRYVQGTAVSLL